VGCLADEDKGSEEELDLLAESKADSHRSPTWHGELAFGVPADAVLTADERYHAWWFDVSGEATLDMTTTYTVRGQRRTDTVLYFYQQQPNGNWGSYIARDDDGGDATYSKLTRTVGPGRYRVIVKGHRADTTGKFRVQINCAGEGCAPTPPSDVCLFGSVYQDLFDNPALEVIPRIKITAANLADFSAENQDRLVRAVKESSHDDVTTPEEALSRVDQEEVNFVVLLDTAGQRKFVAFEYGAGDNSYGAIFDDTTDAMVSSIHDGDLYDCTVTGETCALPDDWSQLRDDPAFTRTAARVVTQASQLSTLEAQQALGAFQQSYDDVTDAADGLSRIDRGELNVIAFTHAATGTQLEVIEYGAGDTSVGAIYFAGTTDRAGSIEDLSIEGCAFFTEN
jgi:hypothetical protein